MEIPGFVKVTNCLQNQQYQHELHSDPDKLLDNLFDKLFNDILPTNKHLLFTEMLESDYVLHRLIFAVEDTFTVIILNESVECFFALIKKGFKVQYNSTIFSIMARELRGTKILPILIERDEFFNKENILDFMIEEVKKLWFLFPRDEKVQSYISKLTEFKNQLSLREQKEMEEMEKNGRGYILKDRKRLILERQKSMEILKQMQQIAQITQITQIQNYSRDQLQNQMQTQRQEQRDRNNNNNNDDDLKRKNNDRMEY